MKSLHSALKTASIVGFVSASLPLLAQETNAPEHFNSDLESRVLVKLIADPELPAIGIDVDDEGSTVTLRGSVPEDKWQSRAEVIAGSVHGVDQVNNELNVGPNS